MKIGIHHREGSYSERWIEYCKNNNIDFKIVNAYDTDIIKHLQDCDVFLWHHHHGFYRDALFAKQLLFSLEQSGIKVFPNWKTGWHFDDKLGQKYLFESCGVKSAKATAFFEKKKALEWAKDAVYPLIFKLRGGAGSSNVYMVKNYKEAKKAILKSFGAGYSQYNGLRTFKDRLKSYRAGLSSLTSLIKAFGRIFIKPEFAKMHAPEKGYVYFQEFIPNDGLDYRLEIVGDKAIATVRYARKNDFRASGGHNNHYDEHLFPKEVFKFGFEVAEKLELQSCALDIVQNNITKEFFLIENSYCYGADPDEFDHGYWTKDGVLHKEKFNGFDWMIESVIKEL